MFTLYQQGQSKAKKFSTNYSFCLSDTNTKSGDARKIDEYVPKNIPAVSIRAKYLVETGPKKNNARSTKMTVNEVLIDLT